MNGRAFKSSLTALAVAAVLSGAPLNANALALGEINVYSALGQPFRAEVDVTQMTPEEAASLKASIGTPASYLSAGVEYNPAVANIRVSVQKRPNGKTFLRLTSTTPIHEPYLGIVVDTNWASGRIVRDFTVLLDPPEHKRAEVQITPTQSAAPVMAPPPSARPPAVIMESTVQPPPPAERTTAASAIPDSTPESTKATLAAERAAKAQHATPGDKPRSSRRGHRRRGGDRALPPATASGPSVNVERGDTAGRIAAANLPAGVSLDQMLAAMLRANPSAFIGGDINRLRAGAVLQMPTADEASALSRQQARRTLVARSRNFNQYRQGAARHAPRVQTADAGQSTAGKVSTDIKAPATVTQDGSRVVVSGSTADVQRAHATAQQAQKQEQKSRVEELNRTKKELEALSAASQAAPSQSGGANSSVPGLNLPVPAPVASTAAASPAPVAALPPAPPVASAETAASVPGTATDAASAAVALPPVQIASDAPALVASDAASTPASEAASDAVAVAPAPAPKPKRPTLPPPPPPEPSLMDLVMENLPLGLGGLAVLGGLGYLLSRRRKKDAPDSTASHSDLGESRLPNDSFFGSSGGQQINTQAPSQAAASATSMAYSPSQLDAAGDVDPVAEADVYLAYGRDMQAEEILKEALLTTPDRIAIHRKLLEIYAKRRDVKAFEELAKQVHDRTGGSGEDWSKIAELGNELDPTNPLYQGGSVGETLLSKSNPATAAVFGSSTLPSPDLLSDTQNAKLDLELNGDSRLLAQGEMDHLNRPRNGADLAAFPAPPSTLQPEEEDTRDKPLEFDLDFDMPGATTKADSLKAPTQTQALDLPVDALDLGAADLTEKVEPAASEPAPALLDADFNMDFLSADTVPAPVEQPEESTKPATLAASLEQGGMLEFDMGTLSMDPDSRNFDAQDSIQPLDEDDDPFATKLSLAREFHSIGDIEGARTLIKEVIAEAEGADKARAERFLAELG